MFYRPGRVFFWRVVQGSNLRPMVLESRKSGINRNLWNLKESLYTHLREAFKLLRPSRTQQKWVRLVTGWSRVGCSRFFLAAFHRACQSRKYYVCTTFSTTLANVFTLDGVSNLLCYKPMCPCYCPTLSRKNQIIFNVRESNAVSRTKKVYQVFSQFLTQFRRF